VLLTLLEYLWWFQAEPTPIGGGSGGGGGGGAGGGMGCAMQAGLFGVMMLVFYFFMLRPEQKRRKEHEDMMRSLRKGTKVRTSGGILGEVVSVSDEDVVLQIADRVRINILRTHVSGVEAQTKTGAGEQKTAAERAASEAASADKKRSESDAEGEG
jgi:preprotein translocase subunit YajC